MCRIYLSIVLIFSVLTVNSQGFVFSTEEELNSFEQLTDQTFGFTANIPSTYSFEEYVPHVLSQGNTSTCVGYAMFYYGLSTMYNIKFGITSSRGKEAHAFDPFFIYSYLNNAETNPCDEGLNMSQASEAVADLGAKKMYYPPFINCGTRWSTSKLIQTSKYTKPYAINTFYTANMDYPDIVESAKQTLYNNTPIISGFNITESLYPMTSSNPNGVDNFGLWRPSELEESVGGHAMTLVGYNDYMYGGAFRVVNSWGKDYGDNGFIWIRYEDWKRYAVQSFAFELNENLAANSSEFPLYQDDYMRRKRTSATYEGQKTSSYGPPHGLGIYYDSDIDVHFIGDYEQGTMDGYFLVLDSDGLFSTNVVNGKFQDINQLGFAGGQDFDIKSDSLKLYLEEVGVKYKVRKANSTKRFSAKIED